MSGCGFHWPKSGAAAPLPTSLQHNGLVYSESDDGGYCKYCVLFGKCGPTVKELGVLVNRPLIDFKRATEKLTDHFHNKFHKASL